MDGSNLPTNEYDFHFGAPARTIKPNHMHRLPLPTIPEATHTGSVSASTTASFPHTDFGTDPESYPSTPASYFPLPLPLPLPLQSPSVNPSGFLQTPQGVAFSPLLGQAAPVTANIPGSTAPFMYYIVALQQPLSLPIHSGVQIIGLNSAQFPVDSGVEEPSRRAEHTTPQTPTQSQTQSQTQTQSMSQSHIHPQSLHHWSATVGTPTSVPVQIPPSNPPQFGYADQSHSNMLFAQPAHPAAVGQASVSNGVRLQQKAAQMNPHAVYTPPQSHQSQGNPYYIHEDYESSLSHQAANSIDLHQYSPSNNEQVAKEVSQTAKDYAQNIFTITPSKLMKVPEVEKIEPLEYNIDVLHKEVTPTCPPVVDPVSLNEAPKQPQITRKKPGPKPKVPSLHHESVVSTHTAKMTPLPPSAPLPLPSPLTLPASHQIPLTTPTVLLKRPSSKVHHNLQSAIHEKMNEKSGCPLNFEAICESVGNCLLMMKDSIRRVSGISNWKPLIKNELESSTIFLMINKETDSWILRDDFNPNVNYDFRANSKQANEDTSSHTEPDTRKKRQPKSATKDDEAKRDNVKRGHKEEIGSGEIATATKTSKAKKTRTRVKPSDSD